MTKKANGLGSVRETTGGKYRWEVMVEGRRFSGTVKTKREAQQAISTKIAEGVRGGIVDPSTVTVADYLAQWLENKRPSRAPTSHNLQVALLDRYIKPGIGDKRLQKLTPAELRRFYSGLRSRKAGQADKPLGAATQRQLHQFLKQAFQDGVREEVLQRNVCEIVRPTPPRRELDDDSSEEVDAYNPQEAQAFLTAAETDPRSWWAAFALSTGMRRGEICGLRWQDINWDKGTAVIRENVVEDAGKVRISTPKTVGSRRTVYLSPYALRLLEQQRAQQQVTAAELQPGKVRGHAGERRRTWQDTGRIWTNNSGGVMHPGNLRRSMERTYTAAGVRRLRVHGLRDTYASLALMAGVPLEVMSRQLGHSDPGFTLRVYRTMFADERAHWAMDVTDMLAPQKRAVTQSLRRPPDDDTEVNEKTPR